MVYRGRVRNGMVVLDGEVRLPEGTAVIVETVDAAARATERRAATEDPVYRLGELAAPTGIADLSLNIDHYLYGHPKATDVQQ